MSIEKKNLVIVESAKKAKTIAGYLGPGYVVRYTAGHITDLPSNSLGVSVWLKFKLSYKDIPGKEDIIKSIKSAAKEADTIYIASDPDREGEAIAWHVYNHVKNLNPNIKRVEFKEITKECIKESIENCRDIDMNVVDAQQARRCLDRLVGFMVSPYLIKKLNDKVSAGRVQSVALRMIVDREREVEAFVSEDYFTINATLAGAGKFVAEYPGKIEKIEDAGDIKAILDKASYSVKSVEAKPQNRNPYPPLNTVDMQKLAASKLKFSSDKTMKLAQTLYEAGHVSYIRTDSYRNSPESIEEVRNYIIGKGYEVPDVPNQFKNKGGAQDAHEAIRPTNVLVSPDKFVDEDDRWNLYKIIWDRFVSSQMKPAVYDTVNVSILAKKGDESHILKASGRTMSYKGWLEVYQDDKKEKDTKLPKLTKGEELSLVAPKVKVEKHTTKAPPRYGHATILSELERREIGRPATFAPILTKISDRSYVENINGFFVPTALGKLVVDDLKAGFKFMDYDFTKDMEKKLDKVAKGESTYLEAMKEFWLSFIENMQSVMGLSGLSTPFPCPKCGAETILRYSKSGFFGGCKTFPACHGILNVTIEKGEIVEMPEPRPLDIKCPICSKEMVKRDGKFGAFAVCSDVECKGRAQIPIGKKCPNCGIGEMRLTTFGKESRLACLRFPECKTMIEVPDDIEVNWLDPRTAVQSNYKKILKELKS